MIVFMWMVLSFSLSTLQCSDASAGAGTSFVVMSPQDAFLLRMGVWAESTESDALTRLIPVFAPLKTGEATFKDVADSIGLMQQLTLDDRCSIDVDKSISVLRENRTVSPDARLYIQYALAVWKLAGGEWGLIIPCTTYEWWPSQVTADADHPLNDIKACAEAGMPEAAYFLMHLYSVLPADKQDGWYTKEKAAMLSTLVRDAISVADCAGVQKYIEEKVASYREVGSAWPAGEDAAGGWDSFGAGVDEAVVPDVSLAVSAPPVQGPVIEERFLAFWTPKKQGYISDFDSAQKKHTVKTTVQPDSFYLAVLAELLESDVQSAYAKEYSLKNFLMYSTKFLDSSSYLMGYRQPMCIKDARQSRFEQQSPGNFVKLSAGVLDRYSAFISSLYQKSGHAVQTLSFLDSFSDKEFINRMKAWRSSPVSAVIEYKKWVRIAALIPSERKTFSQVARIIGLAQQLTVDDQSKINNEELRSLLGALSNISPEANNYIQYAIALWRLAGGEFGYEAPSRRQWWPLEVGEDDGSHPLDKIKKLALSGMPEAAYFISTLYQKLPVYKLDSWYTSDRKKQLTQVIRIANSSESAEWAAVKKYIDTKVVQYCNPEKSLREKKALVVGTPGAGAGAGSGTE